MMFYFFLFFFFPPCTIMLVCVLRLNRYFELSCNSHLKSTGKIKVRNIIEIC